MDLLSDLPLSGGLSPDSTKARKEVIVGSKPVCTDHGGINCPTCCISDDFRPDVAALNSLQEFTEEADGIPDEALQFLEYAEAQISLLVWMSQGKCSMWMLKQRLISHLQVLHDNAYIDGRNLNRG